MLIKVLLFPKHIHHINIVLSHVVVDYNIHNNS